MRCFYSSTKWLAYGLSLILCLAYGQASAQNKSQPIKQGETPTGMDAQSWASIQKQMQMSKYKAYPQADGGYASANLAHGFQISYAPVGKTTLAPRDCNQGEYRIAMQMQGIGYDELAYLDKPAKVTQEDLGVSAGSQVTYQWNDNLREWWINNEKGLEQWFSLQEAPKGRKAGKPLHLRMALQTDMQVSQTGNRLHLQKGNTTLHYDKLKVWDATGKEIQAEMRYAQGSIDFYIQEASAIYPLTIDPTWTQQGYLKASNTEASDQFGFSVAISGETVVVGAFSEDSNATGINGNQADNSASASGVAYIFVRSGTTWTQQAYLKASNTGASDQFGFSVAISGETVVVGAYTEDSNATGINGNESDNSATNAGAAYIFVRNAGVWTQQAYLKASNTGTSDNFGYSVAISGETVVVGARGESSNATGINGNESDNSATNAGAAYIFVRNAGVWTQQAYLKASNTGGGDQFGSSVALSGETVVVGAYVEDSNATGINGNESDNSASASGVAYIFVRNTGVWTQQAYLKASNTGGNDRFGYSVAISGETVVVGAYGESSNATSINGDEANNGASSSGAAYIFVRSGTTWSQQAYLKASNTEANDNFGYSVAISGEMVVVGAYQEASNATGINGDGANNSASSSGAAYIFVRSGTTWSQQAYLKASNTEASDNFGYSVAISGETVVVGAIEETSNATGVNGDETNNSAFGAGAAYVFVVPASLPEINLQGNGQNIADGDASPTTTDHTDFTVTGISTPLVRTFTIQNTGTATLNITSIGNTNTTDYTVGGLSLPATISAGSSATFTVTLNSATLGTKTATITVNSDDADEGTYDFAITGRVINATPSNFRGNMMTFNGTNQFINAGDINLLDGASQLTFETWLYIPTGTWQNFGMIMSKQNGGSGGDARRIEFTLSATGQGGTNDLLVVIGGPVVTDNANYNTNTDAIQYDTWYHVAMVFDGTLTGDLNRLKIYINGVQQTGLQYAGTGSVLAQTPSTNSGALCMGARQSGSNPFKGNMDEVRVWNTARTQAQIRENMHLTLSGAESGLISYYQFNETSGNAIDAVAGNNGTLQNAPTRPTSTVSVAKGVATRQTVSATGNQVFGNATVNFTAMSAPAANDEFVAYQLYDRPLNNVSATNTASNYWIVRQFGSQTFSYDQMSFTLPASNVISTTDVSTPSNFKLFKRNTNSAGAWGTEIGTGTSANNTTKVINYTLSPVQTGFSEFSVASVTSPLPITLLGFAGERVNGGTGERTEEVRLEWSTGSEINNKGFEVEMSEDGLAYTMIAFVEGKGNSTTIQSYSHITLQPNDGYYRLKQVDFDGTFSYSPVVFVEGLAGKVVVYPNPNNGTFTVSVGKDKLDSPARLLNAVGKEVWRGVQTDVKTNLPAGIYFLHTTVAGKTKITKVVIER
jgi:Concanavalin A-like lectin/glucanases superfamily/FG-GAP repeat/Secretion system C-terminal sorting domain